MTVATKAIAVRYLRDEVVWVTPEGKAERKKFEGIRPEFQLVTVQGISAKINEDGGVTITKAD